MNSVKIQNIQSNLALPMDYVAICGAIRKEKTNKVGLDCAKKKFGGYPVTITHRAAIMMYTCLDSIAIYAVTLYRAIQPH